jgi:hypothetical protein
MKTHQSIGVLLSMLLLASSNAAPFLSLDKEGKQAYSKAEIVVRGEVLRQEIEWNVAGKPISEEEKRKLEYAYSQAGIGPRPEIHESSEPLEKRPWSPKDREEEDKRLGKFYATDTGRAYRALRIRATVTIVLSDVLKGELPVKRSAVTCVWEEERGSPCPHVGVNTKPGQKVTVFLNEGWSQQIAVDRAWFLIGKSALFQQAEQDSADQPATAPDSKVEGAEDPDPYSEVYPQ